MKRMYGDIKHISVLKTEFEGNLIETEDIEIAIDRYSKKKQERAMRMGDKKNRRSDTIAEPHFRLQSTTPYSSRGTPAVSTSTAPSRMRSTSKKTNTQKDQDKDMPTSTTTLKAEDIGFTTTNPTQSTIEAPNLKDKYIIENETKYAEVLEVSPSTVQVSSSEESVTVVTLSLGNVTGSEENAKVESTTQATPLTTVNTSTRTTLPDVVSSTTQTLLTDEIRIGDVSEPHKDNSVITDDDDDDDMAIDDGLDDVDYTDRSPHPQPPTMEGQLFQDTVNKDTPPSPVNARGM